ncbi:hypothetical protein ALQ42_200033 [Pseudomonas savastanoi pv. glycinea]|uniref:Major facilitator family transporter n=1 Tax=Pseudomonas savastanoi pv. glycinea TaxID=318 RepID=A0A3M3UUT2_PSESG|nr:hypothetical protein ALQ42_200033 [Pseudomonas savastanoi pv. glycinea]
MSEKNKLMPDETTTERKIRLRKVAVATIVGSMLEWYDFYLYALMAATVFSKVFFNPADAQNATGVWGATEQKVHLSVAACNRNGLDLNRPGFLGDSNL